LIKYSWDKEQQNNYVLSHLLNMGQQQICKKYLKLKLFQINKKGNLHQENIYNEIHSILLLKNYYKLFKKMIQMNYRKSKKQLMLCFIQL